MTVDAHPRIGLSPGALLRSKAARVMFNLARSTEESLTYRERFAELRLRAADRSLLAIEMNDRGEITCWRAGARGIRGR